MNRKSCGVPYLLSASGRPTTRNSASRPTPEAESRAPSLPCGPMALRPFWLGSGHSGVSAIRQSSPVTCYFNLTFISCILQEVSHDPFLPSSRHFVPSSLHPFVTPSLHHFSFVPLAPGCGVGRGAGGFLEPDLWGDRR